MLYSDGITEAESPSGAPFDEDGLIALIRAHADNPSLPEIGKAVIKAVERHAQDVRFADDLTVLLARRTDRRPGFGTRDSAIRRRLTSRRSRMPASKSDPSPSPDPVRVARRVASCSWP